MSYREKIVVSFGGFILFLTVFYLLWVVPVRERTTRLQRMIVKRESDINKIGELKEEFKKIRKKFSAIENRLASISKGFSSLTFLETIAQKSGMRDSITSMTPQTPIDGGKYKGTTLEIKIANVPLVKIVEFLYMIENSEYWMKISKLILKTKYDNPEKLDARFTVVSFSKK